MLLDRGIAHGHASAILILASFLGCLLGVFTAFGGYSALVAIMIVCAGTALAVVEIGYGEFEYFGRWLRKLPGQRETISAQMRLDMNATDSTGRPIWDGQDVLIDQESFEAVQAKLAERSTTHRKPRDSRYVLSGVLRCGHCGGTLAGKGYTARPAIEVCRRDIEVRALHFGDQRLEFDITGRCRQAGIRVHPIQLIEYKPDSHTKSRSG